MPSVEHNSLTYKNRQTRVKALEGLGEKYKQATNKQKSRTLVLSLQNGNLGCRQQQTVDQSAGRIIKLATIIGKNVARIP